MLRARASSQARTPVATPMPPTSRAVSPTRVMNRLAWSMKRWMPGAACAAVRMRQPVSGKAWRTAATAAASSAPAGRAARSRCWSSEPGWISPVAGRSASAIMARGPNSAVVATRSGSPVSAPAIRKRALPSFTASPGLMPSRCMTSGSTTIP